MRHRKNKTILDRNQAQRRRLVRNLAMALIVREKIVTTPARAHAARRMVEKMITIGRKNDVANRRLAYRLLPNKPVIKKVFDSLSPRFAKRTGGYTRLAKLKQRVGDGANQVMVEIIPAA